MIQPINDFNKQLKEKDKYKYRYGNIFIDDVKPFSNFSNLNNISKYNNILLVGNKDTWDAIPLVSRILYSEDDALLSLKFIELCKKIIIETNKIKEENINYISLKGHGKIENRVLKYKNKMKKDDDLLKFKESDLIIFLCHSQGVPVGCILLNELIKEELISIKNKKISMISMAGLHHGTDWNPFGVGTIGSLNKSTKELYEMNNLDSKIYKKYLNSIQFLLNQKMKLICFSSYGDILTNLYSSSFDEMNNYNLKRGLFLKFNFERKLKNDFFLFLILYSFKWRNLNLKFKHLFKLLSYYDHYSSSSSSSSDLDSSSQVNADFSSHSLIHMDSNIYKIGLNYILEEEEEENLNISLDSSSDLDLSLNKGLEKEENINLHENEDTISKILLKIKEYYFDDFKKLNELFMNWNPLTRRKKKLKLELTSIFYSSSTKSKL
eukprot:gene2866-4709_t